jgi:hypothetical protein
MEQESVLKLDCKCLAKLQMVDAKCHHVEVEAPMVMIVAQIWSLVTIGFPFNDLSLPREKVPNLQKL